MDDARETSSSVSLHNTKTPLHKTIPRRKPSMENLDRFIPNRSAMDFDYADYVLTTARKGNKIKGEGSPRKEAYRKGLAELFNMNRPRILACKNKPPVFKTLFPEPTSSVNQGALVKPQRYIPQTSERTLDAPDIGDNYYLNLLDWGSNNVFAIGLGNTLYLWDASDSSTTELFTIDDENGPITSLRWASDGRNLAVGLNNLEVQIWDVVSNRRMRTLRGGHSSRVGSLDWNEHILSTGGMDGVITNNDARISNHIVEKYEGHQLEVCGLNWSSSGQQLASGGNDNLLHIWDHSMATSNSRTQWLHRLDDHTAAVKALAWCPFHSSVLASGGGVGDHHITFWNTHTGACLNSVDTGSQSPNGCTVASATGDETLRFWNVFGIPEVVANPAPKTNLEPFASFSRIR
ncbi:hypothetical protein IFM89_028076 [Coptis chinensis]|uniref:CDC20/Fizzy WD40 domain-containing protein n=1 Tax=Coptis chinensis TaxID=261450 RepID=A0A835HFR0_9MAGN|nr:hypothetical protein IFM89_028076 [Coptis chinensis]